MAVTHLGKATRELHLQGFLHCVSNFFALLDLCHVWVFEIGFQIPCVNWRLEKCLVSELVMPQQML
jgi:hypothetical protein